MKKNLKNERLREKKREVTRKEKKKMLVLSNAIHISQYLK